MWENHQSQGKAFSVVCFVIQSFGLNWWPGPRIQVAPNYRYIILDRFGVKGKSSGINLRLSFILD